MAVTGGIVALDDLFVELHRAFPALGAWNTDTAMYKPVLQREKLPDDAARIVLDALAEVLGAVFAPFDPGKRLLPLARHADIGNLFVFQQVVDEKPFFGRDKLLVQADHILAVDKRFDDGGTGGWGSDATVLDGLCQFLIINALAAVFHLGQQRSLCVDGSGFGLALGQSPSRDVQFLTFLPVGQMVCVSVLVHDKPPTLLTDDSSLGNKRYSVHINGDGGQFLDALVREGFEHTGDNEVVYLLVVVRRVLRLFACNQQGVMVGDLRGIDAVTVGLADGHGECAPLLTVDQCAE